MRFALRTAAMLGILLAATTAQADLVAYYDFDGEVEDGSGEGNHPVTVFGGTFLGDVPSQIGSGTSFSMDGGLSGFDVADSSSLDITGSITISAWVNMDSVSQWNVIAAKQPSGTATLNYPGNFELRLESGTGRINFLHQTSAAQTFSQYNSTLNVIPIEWHHVAVTVVNGGSVNFFIDGVGAGTFPTVGLFGVVNDNPMLVGRRADDLSQFFGYLDDLAIWNEALKPGQIELLADGTNPLDLPDLGFDTDINSDGNVDLLDYGVLRDNFGTGTAFDQGDIDGNGRVDAFDFRLLKNALGVGGSGLSVPEPASIALLGLGALAALAVRRSRRLAAVAAMFAAAGLATTSAQAQLVMTVNPFTGATSVSNQTGAALNLDNYSIRSGSASLNAATWTSLADAGTPGWEEANPTSRALSELKVQGSTSLAANASVALGSPFRANGYRDLSLEVLPLGSADLAPVTVNYEGNATPGSEIRLADVSIAEASSGLGTPFERAATHLVDGSGMDFAAGTHTIAPDTFMWLSNGFGFIGPDDPQPFVVFDLGGTVDLTDVKIWNYNEMLEGRPELLGRGVDQFKISVGTQLAGPFTSLGNFSLDVAPGLEDVDYSEAFALDRNDVRFVRFDILSNHNGVVYPAVGGEPDAAFAGLSEVQFFGLAEATGPLGDTNDDGKVDLVDLNNVRNNFGAAGLGDTDDDNDVDLTDLNNVRNNFGAGGSQSVPEPGSLALALCVGLGALALRRRLA